ncbi:MAG TPA: lytic transglycosylase domain-containing protein [Microbacteriaceae bacterium]|nr:lytic transglycosylase domain-containing protein [Microbacteriaceae bacterium]
MSILSSRRSADEAGTKASARRRAPFGRVLPPLAVIAVMGMVTLAALAPTRAWSSGADPRSQWTGAVGEVDGQEIELVQAAVANAPTERDGFSAEAAPPAALPAWASAPAVGVPDPGTAQAIGYSMVKAIGWDDNEWNCLAALWTRESNWNTFSHNTSSGAYGIPQALPGEKMASAGADWATNPATQITWGLAYISGRYGTPCGAWQHSEDNGWY